MIMKPNCVENYTMENCKLQIWANYRKTFKLKDKLTRKTRIVVLDCKLKTM